MRQLFTWRLAPAELESVARLTQKDLLFSDMRWSIRFWRTHLHLPALAIAAWSILPQLNESLTSGDTAGVGGVISTMLTALFVVTWGTTAWWTAEQRVEDAASRWLSSVAMPEVDREAEAGSRKPIDVDKLRRAIALGRDDRFVPEAFQALDKLLVASSTWQFDDVSSLMEPALVQVSRRHHILGTLQNLALWSGILGTFLGLLQALEGLSSGGANSIADMLPAMAFAFGTSVTGLVVAFGVTLLGLALQRVEQRSVRSLEQVMPHLVNLVKRAAMEEKLHPILRSLLQEVDGMRADVQGRLEDVQARLIGLGEVRETIRSTIDRHLDSVAHAATRELEATAAKSQTLVLQAANQSLSTLKDEVTQSVLSTIQPQLMDLRKVHMDTRAALVPLATLLPQLEAPLAQIDAGLRQTTAQLRDAERQLQAAARRLQTTTQDAKAASEDRSVVLGALAVGLLGGVGLTALMTALAGLS